MSMDREVVMDVGRDSWGCVGVNRGVSGLGGCEREVEGIVGVVAVAGKGKCGCSGGGCGM